MKQIQGKRPCIQKIEYLQHRKEKTNHKTSTYKSIT